LESIQINFCRGFHGSLSLQIATDVCLFAVKRREKFGFYSTGIGGRGGRIRGKEQ
jgi:hypothetical protein